VPWLWAACSVAPGACAREKSGFSALATRSLVQFQTAWARQSAQSHLLSGCLLITFNESSADCALVTAQFCDHYDIVCESEIFSAHALSFGLLAESIQLQRRKHFLNLSVRAEF